MEEGNWQFTSSPEGPAHMALANRVVPFEPGHIDITTSISRMLARLLAAVAELEQELIRECVHTGLVPLRKHKMFFPG
jgi:DNA invertase Pin-like site-specific DNA recombinase